MEIVPFTDVVKVKYDDIRYSCCLGIASYGK